MFVSPSIICLFACVDPTVVVTHVSWLLGNG